VAFLAILGLCVTAAVIYGIVHDQITARVCVEYFTIGHPPIFGTDSPTLLGIGWGIVATWWMGLFLGIPLAIAARAGSRPKREIRSLVRPIGQLLLVMAACALVMGIVGYLSADAGRFRLAGPLARAVPADRHARFVADLFAHNASYAVGFFGGLLVIARVWRSRRAAGMASETGGPRAGAG
jgi:hypothetical protein